MSAAGERYNDRDLTGPFEGIDALSVLCTEPPFAIVDRTGEPVERFVDFDAAVAFFRDSRALGFVDTFETTVELTAAQRAKLGCVALGGIP